MKKKIRGMVIQTQDTFAALWVVTKSSHSGSSRQNVLDNTLIKGLNIVERVLWRLNWSGCLYITHKNKEYQYWLQRSPLNSVIQALRSWAQIWMNVSTQPSQGKAGSPLQLWSCLKVRPVAHAPTPNSISPPRAPRCDVKASLNTEPPPKNRQSTLNKIASLETGSSQSKGFRHSMVLPHSYAQGEGQRGRKQGMEAKVIGRAVVSPSLCLSLRTGCQISGARPMADKMSPYGSSSWSDVPVQLSCTAEEM